MRQIPVKKRVKGSERDSTKIKEKFLEQREEAIKSKPLIAMNARQGEYIELLNNKPIVIATGFAGTSKTYIPTVIASDLYKLGKINKIIVTRPAISSSNSVGYTSGDFTTKMKAWLGAVLPIFKDRLGLAMMDLAIANTDIEFIPLETVKGLSLNNTWLLVEEASDLTKEEVVKLVTRMGKNSKLVLSGDIRQSELSKDSGLVWLTRFLKRHDNLQRNFGYIDFNSTDDIVRSHAVRDFIVAMVKDEDNSNNKKGS